MDNQTQATKAQAVKNAVANNWAKLGVFSGLTMLGMSSAMADLTGTTGVDVNDIASEIADAKVPVAKIASASLGAYVAIRVWKMVRKAI